jgi:membrane protein implicated in regulation of membrane protease activity
MGVRMVAPPDRGQIASKTNLNRDTVRWIVLPIAGVGALVLVGTVIVLILPGRLQVSLIADWLLSVLFLCPMVVCLFPLCLLMILAIVGMNRAQQAVSKPLQRVETLSATLRDRTVHTTDAINRQTINASVKFAFIDRLLAVFDSPMEPPGDLTKEE